MPLVRSRCPQTVHNFQKVFWPVVQQWWPNNCPSSPDFQLLSFCLLHPSRGSLYFLPHFAELYPYWWAQACGTCLAWVPSELRRRASPAPMYQLRPAGFCQGTIYTGLSLELFCTLSVTTLETFSCHKIYIWGPPSDPMCASALVKEECDHWPQ